MNTSVDVGHAVGVGGRRRPRGSARLLVATPAMVGSLLLLLVLTSWAGSWEPLILLTWLASAAVVFAQVGERTVVRWTCRFVRPCPRQRAQLEPAWTQVLARCHVDPADVDLYLQPSRAVNAFAAGVRSVALSTGAYLEFVEPRLPATPENATDCELLEALLAHELGHWADGTTRLRLVTAWLAAPWRVACRLFLAVGLAVAGRQPRRLLAALMSGVVIVAIAQAARHGQPMVVAVLVCLAVAGIACPLTDAALSRRAEYAADRYAARAGYGPALAVALSRLANGPEGGRPGLLERLTSRHPPTAQRLDALHDLQPAPTPRAESLGRASVTT